MAAPFLPLAAAMAPTVPAAAGAASFLGPLSAGLGIIGQGLGLYESAQAREEAEEAAQRARETAAYVNLMSAAGDRGVYQPPAIGPAPQVGYGQAAMNIADILGQQAGATAAAQQAASEAAALDQYRAAMLATRTPEGTMVPGYGVPGVAAPSTGTTGRLSSTGAASLLRLMSDPGIPDAQRQAASGLYRRIFGTEVPITTGTPTTGPVIGGFTPY
jgi:hypothetical protein